MLTLLMYKSFWGGARGGSFCKNSLPGILRHSREAGPTEIVRLALTGLLHVTSACHVLRPDHLDPRAFPDSQDFAGIPPIHGYFQEPEAVDQRYRLPRLCLSEETA
jgi:hypothetical protein